MSDDKPRQWETFKPPGRGRRARTAGPAMAVHPDGVFMLNRAAILALGEPDAVELLFDPDEQVIGVRAADPSLFHVYSAKAANSGGGVQLSGRSFVQYYRDRIGVPETSRQWKAHMDDGILCVPLNEPSVDVSRKRRK